MHGLHAYIHSCVCMHVCVCIYDAIYMHVYTYIRTYIHTYRHTYIHTYIRIYVYTRYTIIRTYIHTYVYIHTHTRISIHTHTRTHTSSRCGILGHNISSCTSARTGATNFLAPKISSSTTVSRAAKSQAHELELRDSSSSSKIHAAIHAAKCPDCQVCVCV